MDKQLRQLETFAAVGSDGRSYSIRVYEHLGRIDALSGGHDRWEPLGVAEYKLADGRPLRERPDGVFVLVGGDGLELRRGSPARGKPVGEDQRGVDHGAVQGAAGRA